MAHNRPFQCQISLGSLSVRLCNVTTACVWMWRSRTPGSAADTSLVLPSAASLRRRQSCYSAHSEVGILPTVRLVQADMRPVLGEHNTRMIATDNVRVRVAPPDPIRTLSTW